MEGFTFDYFKTGDPARSCMAHYSCKSLAVASASATRLLKNVKVKARLAELRDSLEGPDILTKREMLARLTTIVRTKVTDFQTCGADGSYYIDVGPETESAEAIAEISSKTEYDENGSNAAVVTKLKLHDPLTAMRDISKTLGWGEPEKIDVSAIIKHAIINVHIHPWSEGQPFKRIVEQEENDNSDD